MNLTQEKRAKLYRRHLRVRRKVSGTPERPRLAIHRTLKHMYVQLIDDVSGKTIAAVSTLTPGLREKVKEASNMTASKLVGTEIANRAKAAGVTKVVFDRGGYLYHGRVKAVADAARAAGLQF
jgi:large subunit ribosomal protein L18